MHRLGARPSAHATVRAVMPMSAWLHRLALREGTRMLCGRVRSDGMLILSHEYGASDKVTARPRTWTLLPNPGSITSMAMRRLGPSAASRATAYGYPARLTNGCTDKRPLQLQATQHAGTWPVVGSVYSEGRRCAGIGPRFEERNQGILAGSSGLRPSVVQRRSPIGFQVDLSTRSKAMQ